MNLDRIKSKIITIQGQQVILDSDAADLYGVPTKRINEAIRNNPEKFPEGYIIILTDSEKAEVVENFDRKSSNSSSVKVIMYPFGNLSGLFFTASLIRFVSTSYRFATS